jgi:hypothetical protein
VNLVSGPGPGHRSTPRRPRSPGVHGDQRRRAKLDGWASDCRRCGHLGRWSGLVADRPRRHDRRILGAVEPRRRAPGDVCHRSLGRCLLGGARRLQRARGAASPRGRTRQRLTTGAMRRSTLAACPRGPRQPRSGWSKHSGSGARPQPPSGPQQETPRTSPMDLRPGRGAVGRIPSPMARRAPARSPSPASRTVPAFRPPKAPAPPRRAWLLVRCHPARWAPRSRTTARCRCRAIRWPCAPNWRRHDKSFTLVRAARSRVLCPRRR